MKTSITAVAVALVALSGAASAQITTVNFAYSGTDTNISYPAISAGTGSFSFASGLTSVGLSDLTAFSFTTTRDIPTFGFTSTFSYGLSDLSAFAGSFTLSGDINALSLRTFERSATFSNGSGSGAGFRITSWSTALNSGPADVFYTDSLNMITNLTSGTVTVTSVVPAPGAAVMLGLGGLIASRRRRAANA